MDFRHLLEQAQSFQRNLAQIDKDLAETRATGKAGGGVAQATVNGLGEVLELVLDPALLADGEPEQVARTVLAALQQAQQTARTEREQQRARLLGDLQLPDL